MPNTRDDNKNMILAKRLISIFLCLLILAATIPNLGRIDPVSHKIYYVRQDWYWIAMVITPMILILLGINRSKVLEGIGWVLMCILLAMVIAT